MDILHSAIILATKAHSNQVDKIGEPYILHPIRVMLSCNSIECKTVAILHDVLEDTDITVMDLKQLFKEYPITIVQPIIDAVVAITKIKNESYINYLAKVKNNYIATYVKKIDIKDNMSPIRTYKLDHDTQKRLAKKYEYALHTLNS